MFAASQNNQIKIYERSLFWGTILVSHRHRSHKSKTPIRPSVSRSKWVLFPLEDLAGYSISIHSFKHPVRGSAWWSTPGILALRSPSTQLVTQLLSNCCVETSWANQLIKERVYFGTHSYRVLESVTTMVESLAAGRKAWCWISSWEVASCLKHETENINWEWCRLLKSQTSPILVSPLLRQGHTF